MATERNPSMKVEVMDYNPDWPFLYIQEAKKIEEILGKELIAIYHIGSTAVEGLKAKPIIDIMPVVKNIENVDSFNEKFVNLGYEAKGEFGIKGRRYFRKGIENRTHQIHIFEESNQKDIKRHLAVRDYLRTHKQDALKYGELKMKLAQKHSHSINDYSLGKDSFVKNLENTALKWYKKQKDD